MAPWKLPLLAAAIVVPTVGAFAFGGPGAGVLVGAIAAVSIVAVAISQRPRGPIGQLAPESAPHLLVVLGCAVEETAALRAQITELGGGADGEAQILVLAPARAGFLDRWLSDIEASRREAQEKLVITVAALAKAGIDAEARVGDENLIQAVEDQLRSYPASAVILISAGPEEDPAAARAAAELGARLKVAFRHLVIA